MNYIIYIIAAGSALILGLLLKQPLLPEEPKRQSWTTSAVFPTAVLALGFTAMVSKLGYFSNSNTDYIIALTTGLITAVFSRFILEKISPVPLSSEESSESGEESAESGKNSKPPEKPEKSKSTDTGSQEESNE